MQHTYIQTGRSGNWKSTYWSQNSLIETKIVELFLPFKHASLFSRCRHALNSFARSGFCAHAAKGGTENPLCGLSAEKNISSLTIWLTAVFRDKVHLVWKTFSVTHFLGYSSAIREEWNKKVKQERERERERERKRERERERESERECEKKEQEKGLFKWCYLSLPSSLTSPAHSKGFTSVIHITLCTQGT